MSANTENKPVDLGRRRLTQGGLAGSVLLATFASKNALAAPPYQCTMSGLLSNNQSFKGPATGQSCDLGPSADDLESGVDWEGVDHTAFFSSVFSGVYFKLCVTADEPTTCLLVKTGVAGSTAATLGDVIMLEPDSSNSPPNIALGRAAIAAYVGWSKNGTGYPLSNTQIQKMFNDTIPIGGTTNLGGVTLDAAEVLSYFNYLTSDTKPDINPFS